MKTLHLVLKHKWWDMIECGEKKEEYRDIIPHWFCRLVDCERVKDADLANRYFGYDSRTPNIEVLKTDFDGGWLMFKRFDAVTFHLGYTNKTMTFEIKIISIGIGREELGAKKNKDYFVIKLGKRL